MKLISLLILSLFWSTITHAQQLTQTVRGHLIDQDSQTPLIGATVQILHSDPVLGTVTDTNGQFRIENVPVGRITLLVTYVGYETRTIPDVLVTAAKEVILSLALRESIATLGEIVVTAQKDKREALNEMATVSARTFSVEETQRYAGSLSDPARMVASFAGVTGNAEGNNNIVVRGNSSRGILWKLEGVEIPNPNHFANEGSTGGPVSALNSNMLANSDFFTSAFAPEYGNALSGIFDMRFKNGNNEQREYAASASVMGLDFSTEGPFSSNHKSSYLFNYRYSSLALFDQLGILDFGGVPKYQDAAFKVDLPMTRRNRLSLFGLGGLSAINQINTDEHDQILSKGAMNANLGVIGVNHIFQMNDWSFLKSFISLSGTHMTQHESYPDESGNYYTDDDYRMDKGFLRLGTTYNYKVNARHKIETGIILSRYSFNGSALERDYETKTLQHILDDGGASTGLQAFTAWKYRISEKWTSTAGFHYLYFNLTGFHSLEPRLGLRYDASPANSFTFGFGIHSRLETISIYESEFTDANGITTQPNTHLKSTKAAHFVAGFDHSFSSKTHLKMEAYYQYLFQVPIERGNSGTYSLLNESDDFVNTPLVNKGTGYNYGLEFTLEHFFSNGLYYMSTVSLYQSFYTPADGKTYKTAFDGNYVFNLIGGKEWNLGVDHRPRTLYVNGKIAWIGGARYSAIDLTASKEQGTEVRDETHPFSEKGDDIFILNVSIGIRRNKGATTREFKLDMRNATNYQGLVNKYYEPVTQEIVKSYQLSIIPNIVYSVKF